MQNGPTFYVGPFCILCHFCCRILHRYSCMPLIKSLGKVQCLGSFRRNWKTGWNIDIDWSHPYYDSSIIFL